MRLARTHQRSWPRAVQYPVLGAALALGAPLGYLGVRWLTSGSAFEPGWMFDELQSQALVYSYLTASTVSIFLLLGVWLGRITDRLAELSVTEPLTGLANKRVFETRLKEEVNRARRYQSPLSVLLIDIDRLKEINDAGGHQAGDVAISAVVSSLKQECRTTDLVVRVGGDEFVVLSPSTDEDEAGALAKRIQQTLTTAPAPGLERPVTVSIGIAEFVEPDAASPEGLLRVADRVLYEAKAAGRNCIRRASERDGQDSQGEASRLPIWVRRTEYRSGERLENSLVPCPNRQELVPYEQCRTCPRFNALVPGADGSVQLECRAKQGGVKPVLHRSLLEKIRHTPVSALMTHPAICVDSELPAEELQALFRRERLRWAPVVEDRGVLLGAVSSRELSFLQGDGERLVEDVMVPTSAIHPADTVAVALEIMASQRLHELPVIHGGAVIGVLSLVDLARWLVSESSG